MQLSFTSCACYQRVFWCNTITDGNHFSKFMMRSIHFIENFFSFFYFRILFSVFVILKPFVASLKYILMYILLKSFFSAASRSFNWWGFFDRYYRLSLFCLLIMFFELLLKYLMPINHALLGCHCESTVLDLFFYNFSSIKLLYFSAATKSKLTP